MRLAFFNRDAEYRVSWRRLPHWEQAGVVTFLTWRTADSMPRTVVAAWVAERGALLRAAGIDPQSPDWLERLSALPEARRNEVRNRISSRWDHHLDECHGACVLRRPDLAEIVATSFRHFDGQRYFLSDFVVMPNHVHLLVAFPAEEQMLRQCTLWKRYTGRQINQRLGVQGEFWQADGFDHLVRSEEQYEHFRRYIADNPVRARLREGEYLLYQASPL